ncbi:FAD-binding domain-containing protein [Dendrothele bispora CBS 962.96]|uniref:FAD-binding domain-containing protein n=1 Tax=Dendrothele bispora (strain CBS 962.96) TaxID=1314807 RepID=A0A4S8LA91_DENBC|nr:FAD-binding domain-containing protein [Dendrothele bispora CBS 962.96]
MVSRVFIASLLFSSAYAVQKCKCLPGNACFPSQDLWNTLSASLSQPLISNQRPLASPCYESSDNFNPAACSSLTSSQFDVDLRVAIPNALVFNNWEELITPDGQVQTCPFDVSESKNGTCFQGRVPSFAINVTSVEDIQHTIRFAKEHNLHLVVKNQGHENLGRPFGVGSVELFVGNLKSYNFSDSFVPEGAPEDTPGQSGVTIQPGVQWGTLYALAAENNKTVVGGIGAGGTVGAGAGWPAGGGHGILSPYFGLGVDNVMQVTVVLPNASHVTANQYLNPDLFWALRGGGGPSFGVITSLTYRTHPNPSFTAAFYEVTTFDDESTLSLFETFNKHHNAIADAGWAGFWPWIRTTNSTSFFLTLITPGTPPTNPQANSTLEAFYSDVKTIQSANVSLQITVDYPEFNQWYNDNFIDSSKGFGFNYTVGDAGEIRLVVSSWLIPRDTFDTNPTELAQAWMGMPIGRTFMVGGGAVASADPDSAAVTPAWRTAITDVTIANEYDVTATAEEIQALRQNVFDQVQPLRELAPVPQGGQYLNEADYLEEDWQGAYWGDHYERLLNIKKEVDPDDLFIVFKGVNSEDWDEQVICKIVQD